MRNSKLAHVCFALWFAQCGSPASDLGTADQCANNQWDGQETDVDCGGPTCRACDYHKVCAADRDCQTGSCLPIKVCGLSMTLTAVAPARGPVTGGTELTLTGTNFQKMNKFSVSVAGVDATSVTVKSATQLTAITGPRMASGLGDVVITARDYNTATLAKSFTYYYGSLRFGPASTFSGANTRFIAVGDFNGDAKLDLALPDSSNNNVSALLGNGMGGFGSATKFPVGSQPSSVVVGDFDGDTKADLAVANRGGGNVSVLFGNGTGEFGRAGTFPAGSGPVSVVVGDFNGDTKADLAVANFNSDNVSVLLGNGAGGFGPATNFPVSSAPYSVVVGDWNGDTKADLAVANSFSNNVSVLLGNGAGGFGSATNFLVGASPVLVVVGDVNGDTKPDLVVNDGGAVSVLLNTSY